jgi:cell division protein FtsZ
MFTIVEENRCHAVIKVFGVGGGGGNAINTMIEEGLQGVEFIAANTDSQALSRNLAPLKLQLGSRLTKGLGAGANPDIGRQAAVEDRDLLREALAGADMVFITAGLGGGTGTGAGPVVAEVAKEVGALTVAVVTRPFSFEGLTRKRQADTGMKELRGLVDTIIVIPNEKLLLIAGKDMRFVEAFRKADDVLFQAVRGISELVTRPGYINLDFADVKTIMTGMGVAVMGTGIGHGDTRAVDAARKAISSPLLEDASIDGARGVIINVTGGSDLSLVEVHEASTIIHEAAHEEANIIFGAVIDPRLEGQVKLTVIATGFDRPGARAVVPGSAGQTPVDLSNYTSWLGGDGASRLTIARRHGIGVVAPAAGVPLAMTLDAAASPEGEAPADGEAAGLDVPAFMRRVKQA